MLIAGGFVLGRQDQVSFHLPGDGQTMNIAFEAGYLDLPQFFYVFQLRVLLLIPSLRILIQLNVPLS